MASMKRSADESLQNVLEGQEAVRWDPVIDEMLKSAVNELGDPFSHFLTPEQVEKVNRQFRGTYSGIGIFWESDLGSTGRGCTNERAATRQNRRTPAVRLDR